MVDTSAWSRAQYREIRSLWREALLADRFRLSPVAWLEIMLTARDGSTFDELAEELSAVRPAPLTTSVIRSAEEAMRTLANRSAGAHRLPIIDYLLAASAQDTGAAVLHYDRDYDALAEVMAFESIWLAPAGSLP